MGFYKLFVTNPYIYAKGKKKYIWFDEKEILAARRLLEFFLCNNIYIDGFTTDSNKAAGIYVWNKKILFIDEVERDAFVFAEETVKGDTKVQGIICINDRISKDNIAVFGAGHDGIQLGHVAGGLGIRIDMFIDSNPEKKGTYVAGIPVYGIEKLNKLADNTSVIIASSNAYQEIDDIIIENTPNLDRFHYNYDEHIEGGVYIAENEKFATNYVGRMKNIFKDKKLFLYGISQRNKKLVRILELLDFCIEGYIVEENYTNAAEIGKRIITIEEIIYEDNIFVLISREDYRSKSQALSDLGLVILRDFAMDNPFQVSYVGIRSGVLDVNLGQTFLSKGGMYGFSVIGSYEADIKIVILGASASESELYPFKSWPQFLYEKINSNKVVIYNGSVAKYNSTQEMLKLLRDVLVLHPDVVIVYDGGIDMLMQPDKDNPFAFAETIEAMNFVNNYRGKIWLDFFAEDTAPYHGMMPVDDKFDIWLNNIKRMRLICESEGIEFFSFLNPVLPSKSGKTKEEQGMLWSLYQGTEGYKWANEFRKRIKPVVKHANYINDLSDIFDDKIDIYIDDCHVFECGNKIIADSINGVIRDTVERMISG